MNLFKDRLLVINLLPLILGLMIAVSILLLGQSLPIKLPLFYSLPWGENQLAPLGDLLILPATLVIIDLVNLMIYWQLSPEQSLFKKMLIFSSIVSSLILTVSFLKVIFIFI